MSISEQETDGQSSRADVSLVISAPGSSDSLLGHRAVRMLVPEGPALSAASAVILGLLPASTENRFLEVGSRHHGLKRIKVKRKKNQNTPKDRLFSYFPILQGPTSNRSTLGGLSRRNKQPSQSQAARTSAAGRAAQRPPGLRRFSNWPRGLAVAPDATAGWGDA